MTQTTTQASSSNTVLIAAAAGSAILLSAAAMRSLFKSKSSSSASSSSATTPPMDLLDDDDEDILSESEIITEDDVCKIFDALFLHMQSVLAQLSQQIQQIQMAGQTIPEKQLRALLKAEFERALITRQSKVFEEHDVDEDCLEEATWEFLSDEEKYPKAKKAVERFQKLYENVSGEKVAGRRPGDGKGPINNGTVTSKDADSEQQQVLSQAKLIQAAEVYFDALTSAMGEIVRQFQSENKNLRDPNVAQQLHMQFASVANDAGESALEKMGVTLDGFRASIERHSQSPDVGRALTMLQMKQQQELMAMGVPAM